jgi:hypothetical protein
LPTAQNCDSLKIESPKQSQTDSAFVNIRIENCSQKEFGWQLYLDNERVLEQRKGIFPFDSIWRFQYEGTHTMVVRYWDKFGNVHSDSLTINN